MRLLCCGSGDPILFIHGIPTSNRLWDGIIRRLSERFTCYTLDLPGLGSEPRMTCGLGELRRIVEEVELLRVKAGMERWNVVGHDAGSAIAVVYAHVFAERVKRLALMSPALFPDIRPYYLFRLLRKPIVGELLAPCVHPLIWRVAMRRACRGRDADWQLALAAFEMPFRGPLGPWHMMRVLRWGKPSEVLGEMPDLLPALRPRTIIFHGANDPAIPVSFAYRAAALIPNSKLAIVDAGHFVPLNCPEVISHGLDLFFNGEKPDLNGVLAKEKK
ncbi:MAG TPA: alpha/beta hydrolase [Bryobacteraceae bacterium]